MMIQKQQATADIKENVLLRMNFHENARIVSYQRKVFPFSFKKDIPESHSPALVFDISVQYQQCDEDIPDAEFKSEHVKNIEDLAAALSLILEDIQQSQRKDSELAADANGALPKLTLVDAATSPLVSPKRVSPLVSPKSKRAESGSDQGFNLPSTSHSRLMSEIINTTDSKVQAMKDEAEAPWQTATIEVPVSSSEDLLPLQPIVPIAKHTDIRPLVSVAREPIPQSTQKLRMESRIQDDLYMPVRQGHGPFNSGTIMPGVLESMNSFAKVLEDVEILKTKMYADEQKVKEFKLKLSRMERSLAEVTGENVGVAWEELGSLYSRLVGTSSWLDYYIGVVDGLRLETLNNTPLVSQSCLIMVQKDLEAVRIAARRYSSAMEYLVQRLTLAQNRTAGKVDPILAAHAGEPEEISTMFVEMVSDDEFVKALEKMGTAIGELFHRFNEQDISKIPSPGEFKGTVAVLYLHLSPCVQFKSKLVRLKRKFEFQNRKANNLGLQGMCCPLCMVQPKIKQSQVEQGMLYSNMVNNNTNLSLPSQSSIQQIIPELRHSGRPKSEINQRQHSYSPQRTRPHSQQSQGSQRRSPIVMRSLGKTQVQYQKNMTASSHFPQLKKTVETNRQGGALFKKAMSIGV